MNFSDELHATVRPSVSKAPAPASPEATASNAAFEALRREIEQATDWSDLAEAIERTKTTYEAQAITHEQAEALTTIVDQERRTLPEMAKDAPPLRLSDLFRDSPVRRVWSAVLGEEVLFLADDAPEPEGNTLAVYRQSELKHLVGTDPEKLKALHRAKLAFDGEVIEGAPPTIPTHGSTRQPTAIKAAE